ncbi:hypothetical protein [Streptomyces sp. NPDC048248]|uniref:hypothetical protein n=1 Tax=Streptomyces sp. NPDC048248 TaxID=3365523 RepID=UPI00371C4997
MISNAKIGAAVVGGYLLGRTKKAKMAIGLGMFLAGRKLSLNPRELGKLVANSPVLGPLNDQVRAELVDATKSAATSAVTQRMSHLADSLHERALGLGESDGPQDRAEEPAEDADTDADAEADTDDDDQSSPDSQDGSGAETARRKKPARTAKSSAGKASSGARRAGSGTAGAARKSASSGSRKAASGTARKTASGARKTASAARRTAERGGGRNG